MLVFARTMKKEELNQRCGSGPDHRKAAAHLAHVHSVLNSSQNHSSCLQELVYFNRRNCSLFNTVILLPSVGKEMPLSLSESAGRNSSAAAPRKDSFHLHFSSGKDECDKVSCCINSVAVMGWLEKACSFAGDFSSCCLEDNSIHFAHFWQGNFLYNQPPGFLELETSSSKKCELQLVFLKESEHGGLPDLCSVPDASLNEYAMGLINNQICFFLCCLNLVSSEQTLGDKKMLSNLQGVTTNFHIVQLVISVLAFALAGLWYAVVRVKGY